MEHEIVRPLSASQMESLEEATANYQDSLLRDGAAVRYLQRRGIEEATALTFRLGVVANPMPGHEKYVGWLALPYLDHLGKPVSLRFRCLEQHDHRALYHGKYMSLPDEPARVFNVGALHRAIDTVDVTEGELDAVILDQLGLYAAAIPGASGFQDHHAIMLAGFNRVRVWGDPDEAGSAFVKKVQRALDSAKGVRLLDGDVTDTFLKHGPAALLDLIDNEQENE